MKPEPLPLPSAEANDPLLNSFEQWRLQLSTLGIQCKALALHGLGEARDRGFPNAAPELANLWQMTRERIAPEQPIALTRFGTDLLVVMPLSGPGNTQAFVGLLVAPPHTDKTLALIQMASGWLQLTLSSDTVGHSIRAARLLELLGHVSSQTNARAAAQEWMNRTASWARAECPALERANFSLFTVRNHSPAWWVSSDTAWAEHASPALRAATDRATRAALEVQEQDHEDGWALPLLEEGEVSAILVVQSQQTVPESARVILRACASAAEPLLRHWRSAERALWRHALQATAESFRKLTGQGHWVWKVSAVSILLALIGLFMWPIPDRVTADLVIEGRVRQLVTAPFDGFVLEALARPGDSVQRGQILLKLDDRDLLLERNKYRSARDQAAGKLRQAMGEREAAQVQQTAAELREAEAQLTLVEAKLARSTLLAPLNAIVVTGDWTQKIGTPVETGKELFELAAAEGYRVVLHVPDSDIAKVHVGQPGVLRLTGQPDKTHAFRIATVTATASVQDGTNGFRVEAEWDGTPPVLSPGMQGVGKIAVGHTNVFTMATRSSIDWLRLKMWSLWW